MLKNHQLHDLFSELKDPRQEKHSTRHNLVDILMLTIIAVICGADSWVDIERFGKAKENWLKSFLELPNGIPSHDTIGNLFSRLSSTQLQSCFLKWVKGLFDISNGEIIAIDGKTLRRSYDKANNKPAIHMVSAWACENKLVLGQYKTKEKSNEITAIPELLKALDLKGNTVTIDAMGCQKGIANQIISQEGDYVFSLKGNHSNLHEDVKLFIETFKDTDKFNTFKVVDGDHGRVENRKYWITEDISWLDGKSNWRGLKSIGMVQSERFVKSTNKTQLERRFFISSLPADAKRFAKAVRMHWSIENSLHWCLDVGFNEDGCRIRKGFSSENFAVIRHMALNLLKKEITAKVGIRTKRLNAGWDNKYLAKVLNIKAS